MSISAIILLGAFSSVEAVKLPNKIQLDGDILKRPDTSRIRLVEGYGKLPLHFEANQGQADPKVRFLSRGRGYTLFLTREEAVFSLRRPNPESARSDQSAQKSGIDVLRMKWLRGNPNPQIDGLELIDGKSHYFIGNNPEKWKTDICHYRKVQYRNIYPGIDLIYYGNQGRLEYDIVVSAGADPQAVRLTFAGVEGVRIDDRGNLIFRQNGGEIILQTPLIYQKIEGEKRFIDGSYVIHSHEEGKTNGKHTIGFRIGKYETTKPLVIDPVLIYSTYLGGSDDDYGRGIAVDSSENAYVTGYTSSTNFPTQGEYQTDQGNTDVFITKLNSDGSALVYSTYLGGGNNDYGRGIAVDSSGNAYVTGDTGSNDFPTQGEYQGWVGGGPDVFVTKLNSDGDSLVYSTYLGD